MALAAAQGFGEPASLDHLCGLAGTRGNLRDVVKVANLARLHAGDGPVEATHVAAAIAETRLKPGWTRPCRKMTQATAGAS